MANPNEPFHPEEPDFLTKARAEALKQAAEKDRQQAEYYKQQARYHGTQADKAEVDKSINDLRLKDSQYYSEQNRIRHDHSVRQELFDLQSNGMTGTFRLEAPIRDKHESIFGSQSSTVDPVINRLEVFSAQNPGKEINIVLNSPGGEITAGMKLYAHIRDIKVRGDHYITTGTSAMAASMAGVLLQVGDRRWMSKESSLLIHEGSGGRYGTIGQMDDQDKYHKKLLEKIIGIFLEKSNGKITRQQFMKKWNRTDWWLDAEEALAYGFIDEIR